MKLTARLLAEVALPGARRLISHRQGEYRVEGRFLAGMATDDHLVVHDIERLLAGDTEPVASFPGTWSEWLYAKGCFTPDLTTAIYSQREQVVAVDAAGNTRWSYPHEPRERQHEGSVLAKPDQIWATVPGANDSQDWVVLNPADGQVLGRTKVLDWPQPFPHQHAHPDGQHVVVCFTYPDYSSFHWGRLTPDGLATGEMASKEEDIYDICLTGKNYVTVHHQGYWVIVSEFPTGEVLTGAGDYDLGEAAGEEGPDENGYWGHRWENQAGFLTPDTVIACASTSDYDEYSHWLYDIQTEQLRGPITYPKPIDDDIWLRALGNGTWLTADEEGLRHWTIDG